MKAAEMRKAAAGGQAAFLTTSNTRSKNTAPLAFRQRAKRAIVALALWGLVPVKLAEWIIRRGGLRHV